MHELDLYEKGRPFAYRAYFRRDSISVTSIHWHEQIEILYSYSENAVVQCGNEFYHMKKGDLIFVNSNQIHAIKGKDFAVIKFSNLFFPELFKKNTVCKPLIENDICITELFDRMNKEECNYDKISDLNVLGMIYDLLTYIIRNYKLSSQEAEFHLSKMNRSRKILHALDYIEENYYQKITISTLANQCHLSENYFCNLFKSQTGYTPTAYINNLRMAKSLELLTSTQLTITEIASKTGFDDSSYFAMLFKKHYGKPPKIYKGRR